MKFIGLDGQNYTTTLNSKLRGNASKLHLEADSILKELFPFDRIYYEVPIKGTKSTLYLDIVIPTVKLAVEVNGEQHTKFNKHFFSDKRNFLQAQRRDGLKNDWAIANDFTLIQLDYNNKSDWRDIIVRRHD